MAEAILKDQHRILPCAAFLQGEYGVKDLFIGVLCQLGAVGLEKVVDLELNPEEQSFMEKSVAAVKDLVESLEKLEY